MAKQAKYVFFFGDGKAEGNGKMKELLGGKGANLAEMAGHPSLKLPVPPGFTITTEVCTFYYDHGRKYPPQLREEVTAAVRRAEKILRRKFGDRVNPLLFSVRSGARSSMPGMMETVLNVGLTSKTIEGLIRQTSGEGARSAQRNGHGTKATADAERFAYDAYRRLIM